MFIHVTNARTGKKVVINSALIGMVDDRSGDNKYPNTNAAIILNDSRDTFIPCRETIEEIESMMGAPSKRQVMDTRHPDDPGPQPR